MEMFQRQKKSMYLSVFGFHDKEGLSVLPQLHVKINRLPVDLYVHLVKKKGQAPRPPY